MFSDIFTHFGIIIFPLLVYQLWAFRKSFTNLPYATPIVGFYGGVSAILSELYPIHILGISFDFKSIPLTLSFLYGKRNAGLISLAMAMAFRAYMGHTGVPLALISMILYCIPAFFLSKRFESFPGLVRNLLGISCSLFATLVQMLFVYAFFASVDPGHGWAALRPYWNGLAPGAAMQVLLVVPAIMMIDHIVETGKIRKQLLEYRMSLEESETRYRMLIESNPHGICAVDQMGTYIFANPAFEQITSYASTELQQMTKFELWPMDQRQVADDIHQNVLQGETVRNLEIEIQDKHGVSIPVRVHFLPLYTSNQIVGYCGIVEDLRTLRTAERLILQAEKLSTVGELAAGIAHEIRNPLTALKGFLKLIPPEDENVARYLRVMSSEMDRLYSVSNQLLSLAKPQMETKQPCNMNELMADVLQIMETEAILANVELRASFTAHEPHVVANVDQMKQVFINVIKNAMDASLAGGVIDIEIMNAQADHVSVVISDHGCGIPKDVLNRLGEPFYSTKTKGNGLGLMVTHQIIESHQGVIHYESQEKVGTRVTITLPVWRTHEKERVEPVYSEMIPTFR